MTEDADYKTSVVPLDKRQGPGTMTLVWISMVIAFPTVLVGFDWYQKGFSLLQVIACVAAGCLFLMAYQLPAGYVGAKSGQTYALLSRSIFGRWGSRLVSCILLCFAISWYALNPLFLADGVSTLLKLHVPIIGLAAFMAFVMAFNNFFGFKGIANFARYLAAPALTIWVICIFIFALTHCPHQVMVAGQSGNIFSPLAIISSVVIGYAVWGNEPDFFRYGKPSILATATPLILALSLGWVIFASTGWMLAAIGGANTLSGTNLAYSLTFGGVPILGAVILCLSYFACGDSCLYGAINVSQNLKPMPHKLLVTALATIGSALAAWFSISGCAKSVETVASLSCTLLPIPMTIVLADWFLHIWLYKAEPNYSRVPDWNELPAIRWPALIALIGACLIGVTTSGVIPGTEFLHVGIPTLQAWLSGIILYIPLRLIEHKNNLSQKKLSLEKLYSPSQEEKSGNS